jgi:ribonuclease III
LAASSEKAIVVSEALQLLQKKIQHHFADIYLLQRALTHRSYSSEHYERLEFLGDTVLNLAVSTLLYKKLGSFPEGDLSRVRANLVRQESLHEIALGLGLPTLLRLGEGEAKSGGSKRPSILADALEALIAAVFLDAGYDKAQALVWRLFDDVDLSTSQIKVNHKDAKTELQELLQSTRLSLPIYRVVATLGAAHEQTFDVECEVIEHGLCERGIGNSRRAAEQAAAAAVLQQLKKKTTA